MRPDFKTDISTDSKNQKMVAPRQVVFNKPAFLGPEIEEILKAIQFHNQISGDGYYTRACEKFLGEMYQTPCLLTSSCTHSLEMAALLLNIIPGDEVIVPSYTFVSTANAFALRGATIRFADCDRFGQLDLDSVREQLTSRTRAVCVVHYAGNSADMDALTQFCKENGLALVEDAAQAIGASFKGKLLGTWGDLGCLSFHETKNTTSGEGGALLINNPALVDRAHHIREKGTNRTQFIQGITDKYTWVDIGSSYVLSDMNAAHLLVQLKNLNLIHSRRKALWERYWNELSGLKDVDLLETPAGNTPNYHLFAMIFENADRRASFIHFMRELAITAPFHYVALHSSPMGKSIGLETNEKFVNTDRLSQGLVRLPIFYNMTDAEQDWVIESTLRFFRYEKP